LPDISTTQSPAEHLRVRLTDALRANGFITSDVVESAFRIVPREVFAPADTSLEAAYADDVVVTKRGPDGKALSSISAPWLQARMIEQARLRPGGQVLEIGSGGCNAGYIAEVVGRRGRVTTIDIDAEVVQRASAGLTTAGYSWVEAVVADAEHGYADNGPYDAIIVTVESADVPTAWLDQLAPGGVLVVPLRIRGNTRSLAFTHDGAHWAATSPVLCGFVSMQGTGSVPEQHIPLRGDSIVLRIDDTTTRVDPAALAAGLTGPGVQVWSAVTLPPMTSFESLLLWLACQPVPYGQLLTDSDRADDDPIAPFAKISPAFLAQDSLAYLLLRRVDEQTFQFGSHGFGPQAQRLATVMVEAITVWGQRHRHAPEPWFTLHPPGTASDDTDSGRLVLPRRHTTIVVTWPTTDPVGVPPSRTPS
jgi:protein-L-isoaspartate(D-aspartate) O-methyltransferase